MAEKKILDPVFKKKILKNFFFVFFGSRRFWDPAALGATRFFFFFFPLRRRTRPFPVIFSPPRQPAPSTRRERSGWRSFFKLQVLTNLGRLCPRQRRRRAKSTRALERPASLFARKRFSRARRLAQFRRPPRPVSAVQVAPGVRHAIVTHPGAWTPCLPCLKFHSGQCAIRQRPRIRTCECGKRKKTKNFLAGTKFFPRGHKNFGFFSPVIFARPLSLPCVWERSDLGADPNALLLPFREPRRDERASLAPASGGPYRRIAAFLGSIRYRWAACPSIQPSLVFARPQVLRLAAVGS